VTPERIVVRGYAPRAWYAADAGLREVTEDRAKAHRFPTVQAANAAIMREAGGSGDRFDDYDRVLAAYWHIERPTIEDQARAYVDPTAR
jgi:hypothetical protein